MFVITFLGFTVSTGAQHYILGAQWRGLPYHLPFTLTSPLIPTYRLIFSLFLAWLIETADFSVACGKRVFSILTAVMFQKSTTTFSETEACEEETLKPSDF